LLAAMLPEMHLTDMPTPLSVSELPGGDLVEQGLMDLDRGVETAEALLVSMAAPRLRALGFDVPTAIADPELRLYQKLAIDWGNGAHSRYNALVRRIVSFQRAAACVR
jgi:hypothetical protein